MLKALIFDFDGVIAESISVKTEAFKFMYLKYGQNIVQQVIDHHHRNGGMSRFEKFKHYHSQFLNKKLSQVEILDLADSFSDLVVQKVIKSKNVPGVLSFLKEAGKKYKLFISTGTPEDEINLILQGKGIKSYFEKVYGSPSKKTEHIKKIKNNYSYKSNNLVFFGDSITDLCAANSTNVPFILIENQFNNELSLSYKGKKIKNFISFKI